MRRDAEREREGEMIGGISCFFVFPGLLGAWHPGLLSFIASRAILTLAFSTLVVVSLVSQLFRD